jgi:hypothetical protein
MTIRYARVLLVAALVVTAIQANGAQADQHMIAQELLGQDFRERNSAFEAALAIGPGNAGQELRLALITLLEKENRIVVAARRRGVTVDTLDNPEFIAHVAGFVAELKDPQTIPVLAGALGSGSTAPMQTLSAFGELAAPAILSVVMSPQSSHYEVEGGLTALRLMVEGAGPRPLTSGAIDQIRRAAQRRLTGPQYFTTLWYAIDLAVVLKEDSLRRIVELLASRRTEVVARGVRDPALIEQTQKRATDRLAGVPAFPRP